jgi:hypothetical protein
MKPALRLSFCALLVALALSQAGCSVSGAEPTPGVDAKKYWDRCLGTQCPPMDDDAVRKK